jgi:hypothetical protein
MKNINEKFTDIEHKALLLAKGTDTWHDFIMKLTVIDDVRVLLKRAPDPQESHPDDFVGEYLSWLENVKELLGVD